MRMNPDGDPGLTEDRNAGDAGCGRGFVSRDSS